MPSVKIILKKNKEDENGNMPLYLRITKNRKTKFVSLGIKVHPDDWDENKQRVKSQRRKNISRINNFIANKVAEAEDIVLTLELKKKDISGKEIKEAIKGKASTSFLQYFEDHVEHLKDNEKTGSHDKAVAVLRKLKTYLGTGRDLPFNEVTYHFIKKYDTYLRNKLKNSNNTVYSNLKIFRSLLNNAVREEIIEPHANPFPRYKLKWEKTTKEYLTDEEIKLIEEVELPENQMIHHYRNMYIFSAYAGGLRISDILRLQWGDFNGTHINKTIQKTNQQISIFLPKKALAILEEYNHPNAQPTDFVFPCLKNDVEYNADQLFRRISSHTAVINAKLKDIAELAKVKKSFSFHSSRHSFATRALKKGMRIEYVSKLLGHSALKTTQVYAKIVNSELDKAMTVFDEEEE